jgi:hypothetical protein
MWRRVVVAGLGLAAAGAGAIAAGALRARRRFEAGQAAIPIPPASATRDDAAVEAGEVRVAPTRGPRDASGPSRGQHRVREPAEVPVPETAVLPPRRRRRAPTADGRPYLHDLTDIRSFFRTNETPIYFVSATAFNLLGIDRWVRNFRFVNYYDGFDGGHPNVVVPGEREPRAFESIEDIVNYLLGHKEVRDLISARRPAGAADAGLAAFLMFDETSERLTRDAGLRLAFPSAALRHRLDSKIVTTRLASEAGVPSVPNVLGRARSYAALRKLAATADLGEDLVVQTPYGDSGKTTFFISRQADWKAHAAELRDVELKVMRRIDPHELAIEGVVTRHGTLVGPLMTELAGFEELTPYGGGWCGDEVFAHPLDRSLGAIARERTAAMGERLRAEGYRGYFELDFLADAATDELYLGELNPRITGASSITNVSAVAYGDMPLFLFHLLEFMDVDYALDTAELNERWAESTDRMDSWAQLVIKDTAHAVELLTAAPRSGIWRLAADGGLAFARPATDWHRLEDEAEAFYLRIAEAGSYRYHGADLGILVARGRFMTDDYELTPRARSWIDGLRGRLHGVPVADPATIVIPRPDPFGFKLL